MTTNNSNWPTEVHQQYLRALEERDFEAEIAELFEDTLRDALAIADGTTALKQDELKLRAINYSLRQTLREVVGRREARYA